MSFTGPRHPQYGFNVTHPFPDPPGTIARVVMTALHTVIALVIWGVATLILGPVALVLAVMYWGALVGNTWYDGHQTDKRRNAAYFRALHAGASQGEAYIAATRIP